MPFHARRARQSVEPGLVIPVDPSLRDGDQLTVTLVHIRSNLSDRNATERTPAEQTLAIAGDADKSRTEVSDARAFLTKKS